MLLLLVKYNQKNIICQLAKKKGSPSGKPFFLFVI